MDSLERSTSLHYIQENYVMRRGTLRHFTKTKSILPANRWDPVMMRLVEDFSHRLNMSSALLQMAEDYSDTFRDNPSQNAKCKPSNQSLSHQTSTAYVMSSVYFSLDIFEKMKMDC